MAINPDKVVVQDKAYYTPRVDIYDKDNQGPVLQLGVTLSHFTGDLYMKLSHFDYIATQKLNYTRPADSAEQAETIKRLSEELNEMRDKHNKLQEELSDQFNERLDRLIAGYVNRGNGNGDAPPVASNSNRSTANKDSKSNKKSLNEADDDF